MSSCKVKKTDNKLRTQNGKLERLPDEILVLILSHLNKRDLCRCSCVCKRWNTLTYTKELWGDFSLTDIVRPKWSASKLLSTENSNYLIEKRFGSNITRVDLAKLCFSFETLDTLFQSCTQIESLCINFKYLQIRSSCKYLVQQLDVHKWPVNRLKKLYLKNVCDMKIRRYCGYGRNNASGQPPTSYDMIELQIIQLICTLFKRNSSSLKVLGFKCVDPNVISSCVKNFENLEILLLNNINDTDSVLSEIALICKKLKSLELTKCKEFSGDGLQELIEQISNLETLQLGKYIHPEYMEFIAINWSNLKSHLKEISISTKFPSNENYSALSSSPQSTCSTSSSSPISSPLDLYSKTLFNYLNDNNHLEYIALEDFTLKFPNESKQLVSQQEQPQQRVKRFKRNSGCNPNLKYLFLRNIRKQRITLNQADSLKSFLEIQCNLHTLDLIGICLNSDFICSILYNLNNLKVLNFGHGNSYKRASIKFSSIKPSSSHEVLQTAFIEIDAINLTLAKCCKQLTHLGIFYRQSELKFKKHPLIQYKNDELITLLTSCKYMKQISYLKSFKIKDDDDEPDHMTEDSDVTYHNYFHYIRYAIQNASSYSPHIDMKPCYGFDLTPSTGYLLEKNGDFIETTLPIIKPPRNDFHFNLLKNSKPRHSTH